MTAGSTFRDRRCLVTGAASGLGRALALALADHGAALVLTDRDARRLDETARTIRERGERVLRADALDVTDHDAVRALAEATHRDHGSLDVVMNVAGIAVWGTVDALSHAQWRKCIEVNLMGPIHVVESFVPAMIDAGRGGHLVNVSSAAGLFGLPWHAPYSASKFGLRGLSEVLRFDLATHGIAVSLVCPGAIDTGLVDTVEIAGAGHDTTEARALRARFRRLAVSPEHAARAVLRGVARRQYYVYTSSDIALGHWAQRTMPWLYALAMRRLNARVGAALRGATRASASIESAAR